jgi:hypothetical protein
MFTVSHPQGEMESSPPLGVLEKLLDELETLADDEHPDVGVVHESGWGLSVGRSLDLTWEDVEGDGGIFHMRDAGRDLALTLMRAVATGDLEFVRSRPWQPGYPR